MTIISLLKLTLYTSHRHLKYYCSIIIFCNSSARSLLGRLLSHKLLIATELLNGYVVVLLHHFTTCFLLLFFNRRRNPDCPCDREKLDKEKVLMSAVSPCIYKHFYSIFFHNWLLGNVLKSQSRDVAKNWLLLIHRLKESFSPAEIALGNFELWTLILILIFPKMTMKCLFCNFIS